MNQEDQKMLQDCQRENEVLRQKWEALIKSDHELSQSYIRIRKLVGAWTDEPQSEDWSSRFSMTEQKVRELVERVKLLENQQTYGETPIN